MWISRLEKMQDENKNDHDNKKWLDEDILTRLRALCRSCLLVVSILGQLGDRVPFAAYLPSVSRIASRSLHWDAWAPTREADANREETGGNRDRNSLFPLSPSMAVPHSKYESPQVKCKIRPRPLRQQHFFGWKNQAASVHPHQGSWPCEDSTDWWWRILS